MTRFFCCHHFLGLVMCQVINVVLVEFTELDADISDFGMHFG